MSTSAAADANPNPTKGEDQPPTQTNTTDEHTNNANNNTAPSSSSSSSTDPSTSTDPSSSPSTVASAPPVIRLKKVRKRAQFKSSTTPIEDEINEKEEQEGEAGKQGLSHLQAIRAIQELRSKKSTAFQLGEHVLLLPDRDRTEAEAAAASAAAAAASSSVVTLAAAPSLGQEFGTTSATEGGKDVQTTLIEQQMEKYIAEQLEARRALRKPQKSEVDHNDTAATSSSSSSSILNLSDAQLFVTPAHLALPKSNEEIEESGERWLTGISEQPLSIRDKMENIQQTERAKQAFLAAENARRLAAAQSLVLPANFNANFKLHKKEWDGKRREEFKAFHEAQMRQQALANGLPVPMPSSAAGNRTGTASLIEEVNALPGFLAGGGRDQPRYAQPNVGGNRGGGGRGDGVPAATDDRVVDRFIKRFKYK